MLQRHLHFALSLFCSVTLHNLPVLFESRILYRLACSEHRCTCCECAQTPQIKHACSVRTTVRMQAVSVLDKNKAQICCSERTSGTGGGGDVRQHSNCIRYRVVFGKLIPRRNLVGTAVAMQTSAAVMQDSRSFGALHWAAAFSFNCSVL